MQLIPQRREDLITSSVLFIAAAAIFWFSPVKQVTESAYSMLLSEGLLQYRSFALDRYNIPRLEPVYHDHTWKNGNISQLEVVGEHFYYYSPPGSSVLSIPFVAVMNAFGVSAHNPDGTFNREGEMTIETSQAALLMAALTVVVFLTARLLLPLTWSLIVAVGGALGTQVWSTTSRGLWADTWGIFLVGLVVYVLLASEVQKRRFNPVLLATLLSWTYFVRPTNAAVIVAITCFVLIRGRELFRTYAITGAVWLLLFITYSWIHYHALLPTYFRINKRLNFDHFAAAVTGNLISPSRGLFVFVPVSIFVLLVAWRFRRSVSSRSLLYLATTICASYVLVVSTFDPWWAGASFGPRYLAPLIPWLVLLAIVGLDAMRRTLSGRRKILELSAGAVLLLFSIIIQGIGATSERAWGWNTEGDIDHDPYKVWSLRNSQLLAAFRSSPSPEQFPPLPQRIELSSAEAEKYLGNGWSGPEQGFRWTDGTEATLRFDVKKASDVTLRVSLTPFLVPGKHERQRMEVVLNGDLIQTLELRNDRPSVYEFKLPRNKIRQENVLTWRLPDATSPSAFQLGRDQRLLGVAVQWIGFEMTGP